MHSSTDYYYYCKETALVLTALATKKKTVEKLQISNYLKNLLYNSTTGISVALTLLFVQFLCILLPK